MWMFGSKQQGLDSPTHTQSPSVQISVTAAPQTEKEVTMTNTGSTATCIQYDSAGWRLEKEKYSALLIPDTAQHTGCVQTKTQLLLM